MKQRGRSISEKSAQRGELRRVALLLALATAFLLQTLSWAAQLPAGLAIDGQPIEICVAEGLKTVTVGPDGQPLADDSGDADGAAHDCPLCPLMAGLALAPDFAGAPLPPSAPPLTFSASARPLPVPGRFPSDIWARGPPRPAHA